MIKISSLGIHQRKNHERFSKVKFLFGFVIFKRDSEEIISKSTCKEVEAIKLPLDELRGIVLTVIINIATKIGGKGNKIPGQSKRF